MSVLIKGMEMPKTWRDCLFSNGAAQCKLDNMELCGLCYRQRCPLIPVPPHGRLIEECKVLDIVSEWCPDDDGSVSKVGDLREMLDEIEALPTIIPAEEGE